MARPYIVTPPTPPGAANENKWAARRHIDDLEKRVRAMQEHDEDDEDRRLLPRSLLNDLCEGLFLGVRPAEARLQLAKGRYGEALNAVLTDGRLFFDEGEGKATGFLDALDLVDFWPTED